VRTGDRIRLDVERRELTLLVPEEQMVARRAGAPVVPPKGPRGYLKLFLDHVTQADQGVDFDFLRKNGPET
jgi:dihydroxy-acid dehydratase